MTLAYPNENSTCKYISKVVIQLLATVVDSSWQTLIESILGAAGG